MKIAAKKQEPFTSTSTNAAFRRHSSTQVRPPSTNISSVPPVTVETGMPGPHFRFSTLPVFPPAPELQDLKTASPFPLTMQRKQAQESAGSRPAEEIDQKNAADAPSSAHSCQNILGQHILSALGKGHAMEDDIRHTLEQRLEFDLSRVQIHTDHEADQLSRAAGAQAFTTGSDIFFRSGTYSPRSSRGRRLLAHELTHVVQQMTGPVTGTPHPGGLAISEPEDRFERAAETNSNQLTSHTTWQSPAKGKHGQLAPVRQAPVIVQRAIDEEVTEQKPVVQTKTKKRGTLKGWNAQTKSYSVEFADQSIENDIPASDLDYLDEKQNNLRKTIFESKLAARLIKNPKLTSQAVSKVSQGILHYLTTLNEEQAKNTKTLSGLADYSYTPKFFGVLGSSKPTDKSEQDLIKQMQVLLATPSQSPHIILPIHGSFFSKVYSQPEFGPVSEKNLPPLFPSSPGSGMEASSQSGKTISTLAQLSSRKIATNPETVGKLKTKLDSTMAFAGRGRTNVIGEKEVLTPSVGITANPEIGVEIAKKLELPPIEPHSRALDVNAPSTVGETPGAKHTKKMLEKDVPFTAGPSGSGGKIIQNAVLLGHLSTEEMKEYLLACVAYLVGGGNHSFHEVMIMGKQIGINYKTGKYASVLPNSFKESDEYKQLFQEFPDFLSPDVSSH